MEQHLPEFPVAWSEKEASRLKTLEQQSEKLKEIYGTHFTEEAWGAKPWPEKALRWAARPLRDVPLFGRPIPELVPYEMRGRRLEVEEELRELQRLEYAHNRLPQVQDELRMLALMSPETIKGFATGSDVKAYWKDLERLTNEELGYLVHYARALAKATPEQILAGDFWKDTAPVSLTDYFDYFPPGAEKSLSPNQVMSSVAFSQDVAEIAQALKLAYPPEDVGIEPKLTADEILARIKGEAAQFGVEWDDNNPEASMQALSELKLVTDGVDITLHMDTGEEIPARLIPMEPYPQIWVVNEETGEWEFEGLWDEDKGEWVEYHSLFGTPLFGDEEAKERGAWKNLVNFNTFNSISMFYGLRGIGESLALYFIDNFREAGQVYEPKLYITPFLKIKLPTNYTKEQLDFAKESLSKDRVTGWVERKLDELEENIAARSVAITESVSAMTATLIKDYPTNPEYFASLKDMREEYGWGVLKRWDYFAAQFVAVVPSVTVTAGTMVGVTKLTRNPLAGKVVSGALIGSMEASRVLHELIQAGVPPEEAAKWMPGLIAVLGTMEVAGSVILLRAVAPGLYRKMIGETLRKEIISLTKKQLVVKGIRKATEVQLLETMIEVAVQATGNAVLQYEGVYENWWEGLDDVAVRVFLGFLPLSIFGGGTYVRHLHGNMVDAGIYDQYTVRKQELVDAGLDAEQADLLAVLEVLETKEGQEVRQKTYDEVRPLIEAEGEAPQVVRNIHDVQSQLRTLDESIRAMKKHEGTVKRGITMREKHIDKITDPITKQKRQDAIDSLKIELDRQVEQRKESEAQRKELDTRLKALEREAVRECVLTERVWDNLLDPTAKRVYLQRLGLPLDFAAKKWADLSPKVQAMLLRDVEGAPPLEAIVQDSDMVAQKRNLVIIRDNLTKELTMLEKSLEAQEAGAKDKTKTPLERGLFKEAADQSKARIAELRGDLTQIGDKLNKITEMTPGVEAITPQSVGDKVIRADRLTTQERMFYDANVGLVNAHINEMAKRAGVIGPEAVDKWLIEQRTEAAEAVPTPEPTIDGKNLEQRLDEHIHDQPTDDYGLTKPIPLDAERATVYVALQENPSIARVIEDINPTVPLESIPDGSVNHANLTSPRLFAKFLPGLWSTKDYVINLQHKFPDRPFVAILERMRTVVCNTREKVNTHLNDVTQDPVLREVVQSEESQRRVEQARNAEGGWAQPVDNMTQGEQHLLAYIRGLFERYEPMARILKFEHAYENSQGNIEVMLQDIFKDKADAAVHKAEVQHALELTEQGRLSERDTYLATLDWGIIEGYTPWMMVRHELGKVDRRLTARGAARLLHRQGMEMPPMDKTLMQRIDSYIHQIESQWAMRAEIKTLKHELKAIESKIDNVGDLYKTWESILQEAQHMPPEGINFPGVATMMRIHATVSPAVFSANPQLLVRNFIQAGIFHPYRTYLFKAPGIKQRMIKRGAVSLLLKADRWYVMRASQFHGIERAVLYHGIKPLFTGIPGIGKKYHAMLRWWQKTGLYPKSDDIPRHRSYDAGVTRAWEATEAYKQHKDVRKWVRDSGVEYLHPIQQQRALEYLAIGDKEINLGMPGQEKVTGYEAAALYNGTEVADMTHFNYERWLRGKVEHGAMGRTVFNLITFTRSYWNQHYRNWQKFTNPELSRGERLRAFNHSMSSIVIGMIAASYLDELRGRQYKSYRPWDIMYWELGGLTFGVMSEFIDVGRHLMDALDPAADDVARWRALRMFFTSVKRIPELAVPAFNNFLWAIEGFTGVGELDKRAYNKVREFFDSNWTPQELEEMNYNLMEAFQKMMFGTDLPDRDLVEEAREILHQKRQEIGTVDLATGERYTVGQYGRDINAYIRKGVPLDMLCEEEGFEDIVNFYISYWDQLQEFEKLPTVGDSRKDYRKANPDFELLLLFWERYTWSVFPRRSAMCKELIKAWEYLDTIYGIDPATSRVRFATFEVDMNLRGV